MFAINVRKLFRKAYGPWVTAATPCPKPHPRFRPSLEVLEDRMLLAAPPAPPTLFWNPPQGSQNLASTPGNWRVGAANGPVSTTAPGTGNQAGDTVFLSTAASNAPIIWNQNASLGSLTLEGGGGAGGGGGYTGQQTINDQVIVTTSNFGENGSISTLNLNFATGNGTFAIDGGDDEITNFNIVGSNNGQTGDGGDFFMITDTAQAYMGGLSTYSESISNAQISVDDSTGGLTIGTQTTKDPGTPVNLKNDAYIGVGTSGTLTLTDSGNSSGVTFVKGDGANGGGQSSEMIDVEAEGSAAGTVDVYVAGNDTIGAEVWNNGTFNIYGQGNSPVLNVLGSGIANFQYGSFYNTNLAFFTQDDTGYGAAVVLGNSQSATGNVTLNASYGYYQIGGKGDNAVLMTVNSNATLSTSSVIQIGSNSQVEIDPTDNLGDFKTLTFNAQTVDFNGELVVKVLAGGNSSECDTLDINGNTSFGSTASISPIVYSNGGFMLDGDKYQVFLFSAGVTGWAGVKTSADWQVTSTLGQIEYIG